MPRKKQPLPKIYCRTPNNLDIDGLLLDYPTTILPFKREIVISILEYFYQRQAKKLNINKEGYVKLNSRHLRVLSSRYAEYITWMKEAKILLSSSRYEVGKYSKGYKLFPEYRELTKDILLQDRVTINAKRKYDEFKRKENEIKKEQGLQKSISKEIITFLHIIDPKEFKQLYSRTWRERNKITEDRFKVIRNSNNKWKVSLPTINYLPSPSSSSISTFTSSSNSSSTSSLLTSHSISPLSVSPYVSGLFPKLYIPSQDEVEVTLKWLYDCLSTVRPVSGWKEYASDLVASGTFKPTKYESAKSNFRELEESITHNNFRFLLSDSNGRLNTVITSMPKEMRSYISLDGYDDLVSIDLTAAHPFFLLPMARELWADEGGISSLYSAIENDLYQVVGQHIYGDKYTHEKRRKIKKNLMFALYGKSKDWGTIMAAMYDLFGETYHVLREAVRIFGNREAALHLQQVESDFVLKIVGFQLKEAKIPVLTVHDCWVVPSHMASEACGIIERAGMAYTGFKPIFKVEPLERPTLPSAP